MTCRRQTGAARARDRRRRRRGHARGTDRQGVRRARDRRVQRREGGTGPLAGRRRRDRLHAEDFTDGRRTWDAIVDTAGRRSLRSVRRALAPKGTLAIVGGDGGGKVTGGFFRMILRAPVLSLFTGQRLRPVMSKETHEDLEALARLIEGGGVTPVVGRTFALVEAPEAVRYLEQGHAAGKVVVTGLVERRPPAPALAAVDGLAHATSFSANRAIGRGCARRRAGSNVEGDASESPPSCLFLGEDYRCSAVATAAIGLVDIDVVHDQGRLIRVATLDQPQVAHRLAFDLDHNTECSADRCPSISATACVLAFSSDIP